MNQSKSMVKHKRSITDRPLSYNEYVKNVLNESTHIHVLPMSTDTNNNLIYSLTSCIIKRLYACLSNWFQY